MNKEVILIIGASSNIGCELIRTIANNGNVIIAHYNSSEDKIKRIHSEIDSELIPIKADLLDEGQTNSMISMIKEKFNFPNKIVHLPALKMNYIRFKEITWEDFQKDINVQLKSAILVLKEFLPKMAKERKGKVVFALSSCTLNIPPKALAHYITVKYGLLGLMKSLASEYADKTININAVSPSMIETCFLDNIPDKIIELNAEAHPLKRNATVKDIVPVIKFLLSDAAAFISGVNIPVTGGSIF